MISLDSTLETLQAEVVALRKRVTELEQERDDANDILSAIPILVYVYDIPTRRTTYANRELRSLLGYTPGIDEKPGAAPWYQLMDPDDFPCFLDYMAQLHGLHDEIVKEFKYRMKHANGSWVWFLSHDAVFVRNRDGSPRQIVGTVQEITQQKQYEEELRVFKTLLDNTPDLFSMARLDTGELCYANPAYCAHLGYGDATVGLPLPQVFAEDPAYILSQVEKCLAEGSWRGKLTYRKQNGDTFLADLSACVVRDSQNQVYAVAGFVRDLTEQQRAEAERDALQEQVIAAQRVALRELSTPLIPIADHVVIMPLIGAIDTQRAQQVMETLLEGVASHRADMAILDITGVEVVDTQVANALIQAAQAVKLLGAQVLLTGIQPSIAQTLVQLGVDLRGIITRGSLQAGIAYALMHAAQTRPSVP